MHETIGRQARQNYSFYLKKFFALFAPLRFRRFSVFAAVKRPAAK
jgi:hypothetical protein